MILHGWSCTQGPGAEAWAWDWRWSPLFENHINKYPVGTTMRPRARFTTFPTHFLFIFEF